MHKAYDGDVLNPKPNLLLRHSKTLAIIYFQNNFIFTLYMNFLSSNFRRIVRALFVPQIQYSQGKQFPA